MAVYLVGFEESHWSAGVRTDGNVPNLSDGQHLIVIVNYLKHILYLRYIRVYSKCSTFLGQHRRVYLIIII